MRWPVLLLLAPIAAFAAAPVHFAGRYGWEYTGNADAVWTISTTTEGLQVLRHGDGRTLDATPLDARQVATLWARFDWPADTAADVRCVGWSDEPGPFSQPFVDGVTGVICNVPPATRQRIDWIADHTSDWIAYDTGLRVSELVRLP